MAARSLTVVCAWCHQVVAGAPGDDGVTHTICEFCFDWTLTHPTAESGPQAIGLPGRDAEPVPGYPLDDL